MNYAGENELNYILIFKMEAYLIPKYSYFQIKCEMHSFITDLKVA